MHTISLIDFKEFEKIDNQSAKAYFSKLRSLEVCDRPENFDFDTLLICYIANNSKVPGKELLLSHYLSVLTGSPQAVSQTVDGCRRFMQFVKLTMRNEPALYLDLINSIFNVMLTSKEWEDLRKSRYIILSIIQFLSVIDTQTRASGFSYTDIDQYLHLSEAEKVSLTYAMLHDDKLLNNSVPWVLFNRIGLSDSSHIEVLSYCKSVIQDLGLTPANSILITAGLKQFKSFHTDKVVFYSHVHCYMIGREEKEQVFNRLKSEDSIKSLLKFYGMTPFDLLNSIKTTDRIKKIALSLSSS